MTSAKPPAHVLRDLEAIRQVLDKSRAANPTSADGIPILSDVIVPSAERLQSIPPLLDQILPEATDASPTREAEEAMARARLRQEAPALLQEVLAEFAPQLEAELLRCLEARLETLLRR